MALDFKKFVAVEGKSGGKVRNVYTGNVYKKKAIALQRFSYVLAGCLHAFMLAVSKYSLRGL